MASSAESSRKAIPAQLGFLAIYNPSLGTTDETVEDQIVYYTSPEHQEWKRRQRKSHDTKAEATAGHEEKNQQLRRIGLAQGMVEFGRSFSDGKAVDTIETEKSRIILHELESGWWILASIDLTILPKMVQSPGTKGGGTQQVETTEYSSREVKPAILLLGDLLRAHSTFLLHHASSMSALFVRTRRSKFISLLGRYWDAFVLSWNVLMHGNPASSLYGGIKIAACGELGVGVGEEERGSGEREVLEGFVGRIDGLVDVIVSKFGYAESEESSPEVKKGDNNSKTPAKQWLGSGNDPTAEDGAIFLGTGALSRKSVRDVSHWMEDLYRWGPYAYGVIDNPTSNRRQKKGTPRRKGAKVAPDDQRNLAPEISEIGLDPPSASESLPCNSQLPSISATPMTDGEDAPDVWKLKKRRPSLGRGTSSAGSSTSESRKGTRLMSYLKFGYGTHWTLGSSQNTAGHGTIIPEPSLSAPPKPVHVVESPITQPSDMSQQRSVEGCNSSTGHFLIGLVGGLEDGQPFHTIDGEEPSEDRAPPDGSDSRLLLRTLTVELEREEDARAEADISIDLGTTSNEQVTSKHTSSEHTGMSTSSFETQDRNKTKKLRVVVYVSQPFVFVFLFELGTDTLAWGTLYQSLHHQIRPLIKPLLSSTTFRAVRPEFDTASKGNVATPIYDLVWDPKLLTVNSTIPNIPDPLQSQLQLPNQYPWSRIEALNTHMQIINTYMAVFKDATEVERTCKTSRGWWVVWTRMPEPRASTQSLASGIVRVPGLITEDSAESNGRDGLLTVDQSRVETSQTASTFNSSMISGPAHPFLETPSSRCNQVPKDKEIFLIRRASDYKSGNRFVSGSSVTSETGWASGPGKLAQGIGVDTKRYIEGLLNLNR
ncbi:hypothetical protein BGZ60DRAFT_365936 [Tricladium varicosporioides]|nr:hypothetical protein BGZ60DRAFT_365936 [Hymenoscyphus varicosporioides]